MAKYIRPNYQGRIGTEDLFKAVTLLKFINVASEIISSADQWTDVSQGRLTSDFFSSHPRNLTRTGGSVG